VNVSINMIVAIAGVCLIDLCYIFEVTRFENIRFYVCTKVESRRWSCLQYQEEQMVSQT
jgi:hypothetical protein